MAYKNDVQSGSESSDILFPLKSSFSLEDLNIEMDEAIIMKYSGAICPNHDKPGKFMSFK